MNSVGHIDASNISRMLNHFLHFAGGWFWEIAKKDRYINVCNCVYIIWWGERCVNEQAVLERPAQLQILQCIKIWSLYYFSKVMENKQNKTNNKNGITLETANPDQNDIWHHWLRIMTIQTEAFWKKTHSYLINQFWDTDRKDLEKYVHCYPTDDHIITFTDNQDVFMSVTVTETTTVCSNLQ